MIKKIINIVISKICSLIYYEYSVDKSIDNKKSKGVCPFCGNKEFIEFTYTLLICVKCRGLIDYTPFGIKKVSKDAAIIFSEILDWWDSRYEKEICKIEDTKNKFV